MIASRDPRNIAARVFGNKIRRLLLKCEKLSKNGYSDEMLAKGVRDVRSELLAIQDPELYRKVSALPTTTYGDRSSSLSFLHSAKVEIISWCAVWNRDLSKAISRISGFTTSPGAKATYESSISESMSLASQDIANDVSAAVKTINDKLSTMDLSPTNSMAWNETVFELEKLNIDDSFIDGLDLGSNINVSLDVQAEAVRTPNYPTGITATNKNLEWNIDGAFVTEVLGATAELGTDAVPTVAKNVAVERVTHGENGAIVGHTYLSGNLTAAGGSAFVSVTQGGRFRVEFKAEPASYVNVSAAGVARVLDFDAGDTDRYGNMRLLVGGVVFREFNMVAEDGMTDFEVELDPNVIGALPAESIVTYDIIDAPNTGTKKILYTCKMLPLQGRVTGGRRLDSLINDQSATVSIKQCCKPALEIVTEYDDYRVSNWAHTSLFTNLRAKINTLLGTHYTVRQVRSLNFWFDTQFPAVSLYQIKDYYQKEYLPIVRLLFTLARLDVVWLLSRASSV